MRLEGKHLDFMKSRANIDDVLYTIWITVVNNKHSKMENGSAESTMKDIRQPINYMKSVRWGQG